MFYIFNAKLVVEKWEKNNWDYRRFIIHFGEKLDI